MNKWGLWVAGPVPIPPCFYLQQDIFPRVRAEAARCLRERGWSQTRIAQGLRISQAMVSRYGQAGADDDPFVLRFVDELLADLDGQGALDISPWCRTLGTTRDRPGAHAAMADMLHAEHALRQGAPSGLMPEVGLNIAVALPGASTPRDVLSYPARIIHADGHLVAPLPPTLGASGHLARCLLLLRHRYGWLQAIGNVRGSRAASQAAQKVGTVWHLDGGDGDREEQLERHVRRTRREPAFVEDPGGFGIEPCLYVCGPDAATVAERILAVHEHLHA